jgi:hypothetical protein
MRLMTKMAFLSIILFVGCSNPFSSRDSAPPTEDVGTYITPTEASYVLLNIVSAYNERIIFNYEQSLTEDFRFVYERLPSGSESDTVWDRSTELAITDRIFSSFNSRSDLLRLELTQNFPSNIEDTIATLYREYELTVIHGPDTDVPDTIIYTGTAEFEVVQTRGSLWALREWYDRPGEFAELSWAAFKYQYSNR